VQKKLLRDLQACNLIRKTDIIMSKTEDTSLDNYSYPYQDKDRYGVPADSKKRAEEKENDEKVEQKPIPFKCCICGLNEVCHYFGRKPPFARGQIEYVEDTFAMMDPFSPREKGRPNFLTIGGKCRYCGNEVCVDCRCFLRKRICRDCATLHFDDFPNEVQVKLKKLSARTITSS